MDRRSFMQGFFSLALFPRKRRAVKVKRYKNVTFYYEGKKMEMGEEIFMEGHVAASPATYEEIIIGKTAPYVRVWSKDPVIVSIREVK